MSESVGTNIIEDLPFVIKGQTAELFLFLRTNTIKEIDKILSILGAMYPWIVLPLCDKINLASIDQYKLIFLNGGNPAVENILIEPEEYMIASAIALLGHAFATTENVSRDILRAVYKAANIANVSASEISNIAYETIKNNYQFTLETKYDLVYLAVGHIIAVDKNMKYNPLINVAYLAPYTDIQNKENLTPFHAALIEQARLVYIGNSSTFEKLAIQFMELDLVKKDNAIKEYEAGKKLLDSKIASLKNSQYNQFSCNVYHYPEIRNDVELNEIPNHVIYKAAADKTLDRLIMDPRMENILFFRNTITDPLIINTFVAMAQSVGFGFRYKTFDTYALRNLKDWESFVSSCKKPYAIITVPPHFIIDRFPVFKHRTHTGYEYCNAVILSGVGEVLSTKVNLNDFKRVLRLTALSRLKKGTNFIFTKSPNTISPSLPFCRPWDDFISEDANLLNEEFKSIGLETLLKKYEVSIETQTAHDVSKDVYDQLAFIKNLALTITHPTFTFTPIFDKQPEQEERIDSEEFVQGENKKFDVQNVLICSSELVTKHLMDMGLISCEAPVISYPPEFMHMKYLKKHYGSIGTNITKYLPFIIMGPIPLLFALFRNNTIKEIDMTLSLLVATYPWIEFSLYDKVNIASIDQYVNVFLGGGNPVEENLIIESEEYMIASAMALLGHAFTGSENIARQITRRINAAIPDYAPKIDATLFETIKNKYKFTFKTKYDLVYLAVGYIIAIDKDMKYNPLINVADLIPYRDIETKEKVTPFHVALIEQARLVYTNTRSKLVRLAIDFMEMDYVKKNNVMKNYEAEKKLLQKAAETIKNAPFYGLQEKIPEAFQIKNFPHYCFMGMENHKKRLGSDVESQLLFDKYDTKLLNKKLIEPAERAELLAINSKIPPYHVSVIADLVVRYNLDIAENIMKSLDENDKNLKDQVSSELLTRYAVAEASNTPFSSMYFQRLYISQLKVNFDRLKQEFVEEKRREIWAIINDMTNVDEIKVLKKKVDSLEETLESRWVIQTPTHKEFSFLDRDDLKILSESAIIELIELTRAFKLID